MCPAETKQVTGNPFMKLISEMVKKKTTKKKRSADRQPHMGPLLSAQYYVLCDHSSLKSSCPCQQLLSPSLDGCSRVLEQLPCRVGKGKGVVLQARHGHLATAQQHRRTSDSASRQPHPWFPPMVWNLRTC